MGWHDVVGNPFRLEDTFAELALDASGIIP